MKSTAAKKLVVLIPRMMRLIRSEMRMVAGPALSVPQFRMLANIRGGTNTATAIAELHGISAPAVSKIVDGLVVRRLIRRVPQEQDRRVIKLELTEEGQKTFENISSEVQNKLETALGKLADSECEDLLSGLKVLEIFLGI